MGPAVVQVTLEIAITSGPERRSPSANALTDHVSVGAAPETTTVTATVGLAVIEGVVVGFASEKLVDVGDTVRVTV